MLNLQLKQAQCALSDGQLDEAFRLVQTDDIKRHRRGQKLTAKVAKALAKRGREHLAAERLQQALADCNKADELGGNRAEVGELRQTICKRMEQKQYQHRQRKQRLAQAAEQMDKGWLSVGADILGDVEHAEADMLAQEANAKRKLVDDAVNKAALALKRDDLEEAIEILRRGDLAMNQHPKLAEQIGRIRTTTVKRVKDFLNGGRVDLADSMLRRLSALDGDTIEVTQLRDAVTVCGQAAEHIAEGRPRQALQLLTRLKMLLPAAKWLEGARAQAQKSAEALESLRTGPLGLVVSPATHDVSVPTPAADVAAEPIQNRQDNDDIAKMETGSTIPSKFVLQIDGVGAFYVVRNKSVSIGPISSSARPAVGLVAPPDLPVAMIERHDEDYFIRSENPIGVDDKMVTEKLLADGDKIALSHRCRMKFNVPNAASNTATLLLSSAKLPRPDINHVILMDRDILIGSGIGNHSRSNGNNESLALFVRDGKMYCRTRDSVIVDGKEFDSRCGLPLVTPIKIGRLRVALVGEGV